MFEKRKGDEVEIRSSRGGERRDSRGEFGERERRAKRGGRMRGADRGTDRFREETMTGAESFRGGRREVRGVKATEGRAFRRNRRARAKRVGGSRRGRRTRDRAEKTVSRARVRGRERRDSLLPGQSAGIPDGHPSCVVCLAVGPVF